MSRQRAKCGDASLATAKLKNRSVQLVIFSPPYGLKRKKHYPGIPKHELAEWLLSFARVVKPKLKPNGAMVVIIEPGVTNGQEDIYVTQAILALQADGWTLRRNYWAKQDMMPGGSKKLQRDAVEWILHFSPSDNPLINRDTTKISRRLGIFSEQYRKDKELKRTAKLPTKPHPKFTNWFIASPSKEDSKLHPAAFPLELILQLIPIWANEGDLVVDPFCGSGTTLLACKLLNRPCIGIDIKKLYCDRANERIGKLVYQDRMAPDFPQTSKEIRNYFKCSGLTYNDYILFVYIIDETIKHTTEPCRVAPLSRWRMSHCTGVPIQSVRNSLGRLAKHNIIIRYEDPDFPHTKNFSYLVGVHPDLLIPRHHERTTAWKQWIRRTTNQDGEERKE